MSDFRMSERFTPSTSSVKDIHSRGHNSVEKKVRPVAKPRLKLRSNSSNSDSSEGGSHHETVLKTNSVEKTVNDDIKEQPERVTKDFRISENISDNTSWDGLQDLGTRSNSTDTSLECTDVSKNFQYI